MSGRPQHGESYSREYRSWQQLRLRCTDPKHAAYADYGGRGITVCERWLNSVNDFVADMGRKPTAKHEIERIDNNKGYEPDNCRWATRKEQARNRRSNHLLTLSGETKTVAEWCEIKRLPRSTVQKRLGAGWSPERALSEAVGRSGPKAARAA